VASARSHILQQNVIFDLRLNFFGFFVFLICRHLRNLRTSWPKKKNLGEQVLIKRDVRALDPPSLGHLIHVTVCVRNRLAASSRMSDMSAFRRCFPSDAALYFCSFFPNLKSGAYKIIVNWISVPLRVRKVCANDPLRV